MPYSLARQRNPLVFLDISIDGENGKQYSVILLFPDLIYVDYYGPKSS